MRLRLPLALAFWMVMLVTASTAAHGRVFVSAGGGPPAHRVAVAPPAAVVSPGFVTVSAFHGLPQAALVITPHRAIVTLPSATFFRQTVFVSPPVQRTVPLRVTVPLWAIRPKVIVVGPTGSTRQC